MRHDLLLWSLFDLKRDVIEFQWIYDEIIEESEFSGKQDD